MRCDPRLHVVTCITNPIRFRSRYNLYSDFAKRVHDAGAVLTTVEAAFGDRPFAVTERDNPNHVQFRTFDEIWHKENLLNLGINYLSQTHPEWEYVAWVDADVQFTRPDWAVETVHQLQHHMFVQMFSHAQDIGPCYEPIGHQHTGWIYAYLNGILDGPAYTYTTKAHPGYAWAARREALDHTGGLIDHAILGAADSHMAYAMIGRLKESVHHRLSSRYVQELAKWEARCDRYIRKDVGYVPGLLNHYWHGKKRDRRYRDRWNILIDHHYDPDKDLKRDAQGVFQLVDTGSERSIKLRDAIRAYFRSRNEDSIDLE